jgi:hypothetical protein
MDDRKLAKSLNAIGKACFVTHYELFRDRSRRDPSFVVDFLVKNDGFKEAGAKIRVGFARSILNAGREHDALKIIARSRRIHHKFSDQARRLLEDDDDER